MREISKGTAAFSIAIASFALIGSACSHTSSTSGTSASATTSASSATSSATTGSSATTTVPSTQMTGANGTAYTVSGPILAKYNTLDEKAKKDLGAPTRDQVTNTDGGVWQMFDGGVIIYKTTAYVVWGKIRDAWNALGGSQGKLGYPTSDEVDTPDGQKKSTFEHGTITWKPGDARATVSYS
jgi:hypothetical protein